MLYFYYISRDIETLRHAFRAPTSRLLPYCARLYTLGDERYEARRRVRDAAFIFFFCLWMMRYIMRARSMAVRAMLLI